MLAYPSLLALILIIILEIKISNIHIISYIISSINLININGSNWPQHKNPQRKSNPPQIAIK